MPSPKKRVEIDRQNPKGPGTHKAFVWRNVDTPASGSGTAAKAAADMDASSIVAAALEPDDDSPIEHDPAPLENWRIQSMADIGVQAAPGEPYRAGGTCSHCSTAIRYAVIIESPVTGATRKIGMDCAARVGMNKDQLRAMNRSLYAHRRSEKRKESAKKHREKNFLSADDYPPEEVDRIAEHFRLGQRMAARRAGKPADELTPDDVHQAFPHVMSYNAMTAAHSFQEEGGCWKKDFEKASDHLSSWSMPPFKPEHTATIEALFDLEGNLLTANQRTTRFGLAWYSDELGFASTSEAQKPETRRKNNAKKGFYVGRITVEAAQARDGHTWVPKDKNYQPERIVVIEDNGLIPELIKDPDPVTGYYDDE